MPVTIFAVMKNTRFLQTLLLGFILSAISLPGFSQRGGSGNGEVTPVKVGTAIVNLGVGVGADYRGDSYATGFGFKVSGEYGLWQAGPGVITLGPEIGGSFS